MRSVPRLPRVILPLVAAICLLLCITSAILWSRSYAGSDYVSRMHTISADPGVIRSRIHTLMWCKGDTRRAIPAGAKG
jgi:hypothetical protein